MHDTSSLTKIAVTATLHCITGCALGEIVGTVIGSGLNWNNVVTEILTVILAFLFGYSLTIHSLTSHHISLKRATRLALASDSLSILTMEVVDTTFILLVPGALAAGPTTRLFWLSLLASIVIAFVAAVPVNRWLIARGKGHALVHQAHSQ